jgi:hypothetical protein
VSSHPMAPRSHHADMAELPCGGTYTQSEENIRATPSPSLIPEGVRELAKAMIESAWADLHTDMSNPRSYWHRPQSRYYRPEPESAREWFDSPSDQVLSYVWCAQVLRLDAEAVRARCLSQPAKMRRGYVVSLQAAAPA